jgi:arylsulfatase A-like enzyme
MERRFENEIRPNVIFILADDYGFNDIGFHGSEIKTTKMDQLSSDGIRIYSNNRQKSIYRQ